MGTLDLVATVIGVVFGFLGFLVVAGLVARRHPIRDAGFVVRWAGAWLFWAVALLIGAPAAVVAAAGGMSPLFGSVLVGASGVFALIGSAEYRLRHQGREGEVTGHEVFRS